jgi:Ni/Co efflux regulator RcnB
MLRYWIIAAALAAAPTIARAQDTTHHDSTHHHDSSAVKRKANNTVNNAGEGVKQANDQVDNGAYKVGTDVKNLFRGKKKKPAKPDTAAKRDSTPH